MTAECLIVHPEPVSDYYPLLFPSNRLSVLSEMIASLGAEIVEAIIAGDDEGAARLCGRIAALERTITRSGDVP